MLENNFKKIVLVIGGLTVITSIAFLGQQVDASSNFGNQNIVNTKILKTYKSKYGYSYKKNPATNTGNKTTTPVAPKPKETQKQKDEKAKQAEQQVSSRPPWDNGNLYDSVQELDSSGINDTIRQMSRDSSDKKLVYINISKQQFTALEDGNIVRQSAIATGRSKFQTVQGEFQIWDKKYKKVLRAPSPEYGNYELPVDYWMPFHAGYGLHDAWWRSVFGQQDYTYNGSHGCVNMQYEDSKWLFEWSNIGTSVFISK